MHIKNDQLRLSATDLANHLACGHLTELNLARAHGLLSSEKFPDPLLDVLKKRGFEHERKYLNHLVSTGQTLGRIGPPRDPEVEVDQDIPEPPAVEFETLDDALRAGVDVIIQAHLGNSLAGKAYEGGWHGYADVLLKVDSREDFDASSNLGDYHYEVVDTKLARETKGGTILQLCLYTELLSELQGRQPEFMKVVSPGRGFEPECFRVDDYVAYFRMMKGELDGFVRKRHAGLDPASRRYDSHATLNQVQRDIMKLYPEPCDHCRICAWWKRCNTIRRSDDHLTFVAGISKSQIRELEENDVTTLAALAELPIPLSWRPKRGSRESIERIRHQAELQVIQRQTGKPVHEVLEPEPDLGLNRLPEPNPGDLFFDLEAAAWVGDHGLQYMFGWAELGDESSDDPPYHCEWIANVSEERTAFERFIDRVTARHAADDGIHVYHFGHYEPSTLKQLAQRFTTREDELDDLLRDEVFVDLHSIVKQSLRAGVERYSLKDLEPFFGFERAMDLIDASRARNHLERGLELGIALADVPDAVRAQVREYNKDDCLATFGLRNWLEEIRADLIGRGKNISRPAPREEDEESEEKKGRRKEQQELAQRLLDGIPDDPDERSAEQQARWLLGQMIQFHWREEKATWWEYHRMRSLNDDEYLDEKTALSGLTFVEERPIPKRAKNPIHRYSFPAQESKIREEHKLCFGGGEVFKDAFGEVVAVDYAARTIDVKKVGAAKDVHPTAVFEHSKVPSESLEDSISRAGNQVAANGLPSLDGLTGNLLMAHPPRFSDGYRDPIRMDVESGLEAALRLVGDLDGGVLPIQGPPGTGKTFIGARMTCALIQDGKRVGVVANSHKVIDNFLEKLEEAGEKMGVEVQAVHKNSGSNEEGQFITYINDNRRVRAELQDGTFNVAGGTAWMWSRPDFEKAVDVLFVDEAGQMSLANVVACAQGAKNVVLLGDPQQLDQPQQGSHPDGVAVSSLEHLLRGALTMPDDRGLFLEKTWRLSLPICEFTSEAFYQSRLTPMTDPDVSGQSIKAGPIGKSGLYILPIEHAGNQGASLEEVDAVANLVASLAGPGSKWTDREGHTRPLTLDDILIVAPYNAQVSDIAARIPNARVGTVDKFQGQEAPVVIYSMTTSTREDAPRGMEFLYSLNRLNVATSRAKCACILVANPAVLEPDCRNPRQMRLANAFCRYSELAATIG